MIVDCEHKTAPIQDTGYPSIRTPNIGKGRLLLDGVNRVSEDTYKAWTRRAVPVENDLILAREAPVGNVALIPPGLDVCLGQRTVLIRPDQEKVNPHYLCYLLLSEQMYAKLLSKSTGVTVHHLNVKDIRNLELPELPALSAQFEIATILSAYDNLIENNNQRIALLEESARLLYREWFVCLRFPGHEHVKVVDGVPDGWESMPLEDALVLQRGFDLPSQKRKEGAIPIYASTGVNGVHNVAKVKGPGVVTGRSGSLGAVHYVHEDFWPLNTTLWVKEFKRVTLSFTYFLLSSLRLDQYNGGVSVPTLDRKVVHKISIVVPNTKLQTLFDEYALPIFAQVRKLQLYNEKLKQARDLLLPRLMSGAYVS
jgi:type I restriction enzyme S subunit